MAFRRKKNIEADTYWRTRSRIVWRRRGWRVYPVVVVSQAKSSKLYPQAILNHRDVQWIGGDPQ
ncbi:hypothetical protein CHISP_3746 [Chitinispirillum alkaliphilum]|nr:hypothetical protein CHISP_3746 [Chitinispirillum alkaliphilum]